MRIEDIKLEPNTRKVDEKNWNIDKWRSEYPSDYIKMATLLLQSEEPLVRDEIFKTLYKITRLYIPDVLYKYYSLNISRERDKQTLDTLFQGKVYMSEISGFNDPFDGRGFYYNPDELKDIDRLRHCGGKIIDDFCSFVRVACFTSNGVQSMPMWAHYANNHKGFCVAYDVPSCLDLKSNLFPVQYIDERVDITSEVKKQALKLAEDIDRNERIGELITVMDDYTLIYLPQLLLNLKQTAWSHENEFRCVIASNADGMPYINVKPKEIYIGRDCSDRYSNCLFDIADEHGVSIYKMKYKDINDDYELIYDVYKK